MKRSIIKLIAINIVLVMLLAIPASFVHAAGIDLTGLRELELGYNGYYNDNGYFKPTTSGKYSIFIGTWYDLHVYEASTGNEISPTGETPKQVPVVDTYEDQGKAVYNLEAGESYVIKYYPQYGDGRGKLAIHNENGIILKDYQKLKSGANSDVSKKIYFAPSSTNYYNIILCSPTYIRVYDVETKESVKNVLDGVQFTPTIPEYSGYYGVTVHLDSSRRYAIEFSNDDCRHIEIIGFSNNTAPTFEATTPGVYCVSSDDDCLVYAYNTEVIDPEGNVLEPNDNSYFLEGCVDYLFKVRDAGSQRSVYGTGWQKYAAGFAFGRNKEYKYIKDDFVVRTNAQAKYDVYDYVGNNDNVKVPRLIGGTQVTTIQSCAFGGRDFNSITLSGLTYYLKEYAFSDVKNLNFLAMDANTISMERDSLASSNIKHICYQNPKEDFEAACNSSVRATIHYDVIDYMEGVYNPIINTELCNAYTYECKYCDAEFERDLSGGTKHNMIADDIWSNPSCAEEGYAYGKCRRCEEEFFYTLPKIVHPNSSYTFKDVKSSAWYRKFVDCAVDNGIFKGTSSNTFSPDVILTRAQVVQIFANLEGYDTSNSKVDSGFKDVPKGKWYTAAVAWAAENGIVSGVGNGKFNPDAKVTREQICVMLVNYMEKYKKTSLKETSNPGTFADDKSISSWAKASVYKCAKAGLINGVGNNKFDPLANADRAQGATIFAQFYQKYLVY